ncbi:hypothetical protein GGD56_004597 [Rhizobium mongolense]|uniref:Uncharacterized protein n=1 Tax=Rhizobium mongolense TaxID=57676 RepID=A0ABR6IS77_9HYPH|nr:hypothetical protein [Rhizobium mongolense]
MIFLGGLDDEVDDVGETAAATAALFHGVIDLRRHDKLPTVFIEKVVDDLPDFLVGYIVATADEHVFISKHDTDYRVFCKRRWCLSRKKSR